MLWAGVWVSLNGYWSHVEMGTFISFHVNQLGHSVCFRRSVGHPLCTSHHQLNLISPQSPLFPFSHFLSWEWYYYSPSSSIREPLPSLPCVIFLCFLPKYPLKTISCPLCSKVSSQRHMPSLQDPTSALPSANRPSLWSPFHAQTLSTSLPHQE